MARVLVVNDDEQMRRLLQEALVRSGHTVDLAADGRRAMHLLAQRVPDLVIMDLIMPDQEGIETIMEMKRTFPTVPIIAISGGGRLSPNDYLTVAKQLGARETFAKPFRLDDVLAAVNRHATVTD